MEGQWDHIPPHLRPDRVSGPQNFLTESAATKIHTAMRDLFLTMQLQATKKEIEEREKRKN